MFGNLRAVKVQKFSTNSLTIFSPIPFLELWHRMGKKLTFQRNHSLFTPIMSRFGNTNKETLVALLERKTPVATRESRKVWMKTYLAWCKEKNLVNLAALGTLKIEEWDKTLARFILEV